MEETQQPKPEDLKLLLPLVYEKNRFAILSLLSERNESVNLLSAKLGLRGKNVRKHLRILENALLVERLAPLPSPIDPTRLSKHRIYEITELGISLLKLYDKKPASIESTEEKYSGKPVAIARRRE